eukprot:371543_1
MQKNAVTNNHQSLTNNNHQFSFSKIFFVYSSSMRLDKISMMILSVVTMISFSNAAYYQLLDEGAINYYGYFGASVAIFNQTAVVGAPGLNSSRGSVYIYHKNNTNHWKNTQILIPPDYDASSSTYFGRSVALNSDNQLIVGADLVDTNSGGAYIYDKIYESWTQTTTLIPTQRASGDRCGYAVAIHETHAMVGCIGDNESKNSSGAVYTFEKIHNQWIETGKLKASWITEDAYFGYSISIYNNTAVIGAVGYNPNGCLDIFLFCIGRYTGAAYVFNFENGIWTQTETLTASDSVSSDYFGVSVSIYQKHIVIGSYRANNHDGKVYIFTHDGSSWKETQILQPNNSLAYDYVSYQKYFGFSVSLHGNTLITSTEMGIRTLYYIFEYNGTDWSEQIRLQPIAGNSGSLRQDSCAIWKNTIILGIQSSTMDNKRGAGAAHIYERSYQNGKWIVTLTPTATPTLTPTMAPSYSPSNTPSYNPTMWPSISPSYTPSNAPTRLPTMNAKDIYNTYIKITYIISNLSNYHIDLLENNAVLMVLDIVGIIESNYFVDNEVEYKNFMIVVNQMNEMDLSNVNLRYNENVTLECTIFCIKQIGDILVIKSQNNAFQESVTMDLIKYFGINIIDASSLQFFVKDADKIYAVTETVETKDNNGYLVIALSVTIILIGSLISIYVKYSNSKETAMIDNSKWLSPFIYSLQVYDILSDVNLSYEIFTNPLAYPFNLIFLCGIASFIFTIIPYSTNIIYGIMI